MPAEYIADIRAQFGVEAFCREIVSQGYLLHGTQESIDGALRPNAKGEVFAADAPQVALLRAVVSNKGLKQSGLQYPYRISDPSQFRVIIHGRHNRTVSEHGFIYIMERNGFVNQPPGSWQYITYGQEVPIIAGMPVLREDFKYPLIDAD